MTSDDIGRILYLVLLLMVVGVWMMRDFRRNLSQRLQQLAIWALIFIGVLAAIGLWSDIRSTVLPTQTITAENRIETPLSADGHYYLNVEINGKPVRFVIDTGASAIVLSQKDAERIGIDTRQLAYIGQANTANGLVRTAPVRLDTVTLGPIQDHDVSAVVNAGQMDGSLLGMAYLSRFARVEINNRTLILER